MHFWQNLARWPPFTPAGQKAARSQATSSFRRLGDIETGAISVRRSSNRADESAHRALRLNPAALEANRVFAVSGGAGWLAYMASVFAKRRGSTVIADARAEEIDAVRSYCADIVVDRSDDFAAAIHLAMLAGVDALLDTALLGEAAFPAIRGGGIYISVRGWQRRHPLRPASIFAR